MPNCSIATRPPHPSSTEPQVLLKWVDPTAISVNVDVSWRLPVTFVGKGEVWWFLICSELAEGLPGIVALLAYGSIGQNIVHLLLLAGCNNPGSTAGCDANAVACLLIAGGVYLQLVAPKSGLHIR